MISEPWWASGQFRKQFRVKKFDGSQHVFNLVTAWRRQMTSFWKLSGDGSICHLPFWPSHQKTSHMRNTFFPKVQKRKTPVKMSCNPCQPADTVCTLWLGLRGPESVVTFSHCDRWMGETLQHWVRAFAIALCVFHLTPIRPLLIWTQLSNSAKQLAVMTNSLGSGLDATFSLMIYHELYIEIYIYIYWT